MEKLKLDLIRFVLGPRNVCWSVDIEIKVGLSLNWEKELLPTYLFKIRDHDISDPTIYFRCKLTGEREFHYFSSSLEFWQDLTNKVAVALNENGNVTVKGSRQAFVRCEI